MSYIDVKETKNIFLKTSHREFRDASVIHEAFGINILYCLGEFRSNQHLAEFGNGPIEKLWILDSCPMIEN